MTSATSVESGLPPILALVGPTASGKSALAIDVARRLDAEIISADSMQIYRGMDIGTAKVPPADRRGVPHHLIDILEPSDEATVAEFQACGRVAIDEVRAAGRVPVVVGGSGLYISALIDNLEFGGIDARVRADLEDELAREGAAHLHRRLSGQDPAAAELILPGNGRRIVRALEFIAVTGRPFPARFAPVPAYPSVRIGLQVPLEDLDRRIEERVRGMWAGGMVDETRGLQSGGLSRTAAEAIGYSQALAQIAGELSEEEAQAQTALATRRFARRQMRWMRRDPLVTWCDHNADDLSAQVVALYSEKSPQTSVVLRSHES